MKIIRRIGLGGIGPFKKEAVLAIEPGITYLYGANKEDYSRGGNATGKSLFASSPADIFYDTPLVGHKQDKPKAGKRFIEFSEGKNEFRVASSFHGKTEKMELFVNGISKTRRTSKLTRDLIKSRVWQLTDADFRTYAYLDSQVAHPLVRGSTNERKEFFTSFFRLDVLDAERKLFSAELLKIKKAKAALDEVKRTYTELSKDLLPSEEFLELKTKFQKLTSVVSMLRTESEEGQRIARLLEFEDYAKTQITKLTALSSLEDFDKSFKEACKRLRAAEASAEQLEDWKIYRKELARFKTLTEDLDMETSLEVLKEKAVKFHKASSVVENSQDLEKPKKIDKPEDPELDRDSLVVARSKINHELEHIKKFKTGVCQTCGQDVKTSDPETLKKKLANIEAKLESIEDFEDSLAKYEAYRVRSEQYVKDMEAFERAQNQVAKYKEASELYDKRKLLVKPSKVERPSEVEDVKPLQDTVEVFNFCRPNLDNIAQLEKLTEGQRSKPFDITKLSNMQDSLSEIKTKLEIHNSVKVRVQALKTRLDELEEVTKNEKALELLVEAYAEKAVKKMAIEAISKRLMAQVNMYAPLVFLNYTFEFVWDSQIQILVHRPEGTSDVRKLSGAESKLFTLILILSLLIFVPKAKRLSLLILDEPCASFSAETSELFHKLLPHINSLVPSILVVTPDAEERYRGARELTVLKTFKGSKIVQGHPTQH